jgi:hypothetical protein
MTTKSGLAGLAANDRGRWLVAAAGGVMAILLLAGFFRGPLAVPAPDSTPRPKTQVALVKPTEEVLMRDAIPLFMPTEHDAAVTVPRGEPNREFLGYDTLKLSHGDTGLNLANTLPPTVTLNGKSTELAKPADTLTVEVSGRPLQGFGQTEVRLEPLPERGGLVEVVSTATGQRILSEALSKADAPPSEKEWQPMEFMVTVNEAGLVGPLVPIEGSRVEEVDAYFKRFLVQNFRLGARLPPGFYRVVVGP